MPTEWLKDLIEAISRLFPADSLLSFAPVLKGLAAIILVSIVCGAVGSLVVGKRMAFFSDALAHCTFAGATFGLLTGIIIQAEPSFYEWGVPAIMVAAGVVMGLGIALVREKTGLANDTVIGVFFAGAIAIGAALFNMTSRITRIDPGQFIFGDPTAVGESDLIYLFGLTVVVMIFVVLLNNQLLFTTFQESLARSRGLPVRFCNFAFIVLLSLIVNLSLRTVGALLINGLLIVPAATAANLCRNMRQLFWTTMGLSVGVSLVGFWGSVEINASYDGVNLGQAGSILLLSVVLFFLSMLVGHKLRGHRPTMLRGS